MERLWKSGAMNKIRKGSSVNVLWKDASIRRKMVTIFGIILFIFLVGLYFTFSELNNVEDDLISFEKRSEGALVMNDVGAIIRAKYIQASDYARTGEYDQEEYEERNETLSEHISLMNNQFQTEEQQGLFNNILRNNNMMDQTFGLMIETDDNDNYVGQLARIRSDIVDDALELSSLVYDDMLVARDQANQSVFMTKVINIIAISVSSILGFILVFFFSRSVSKSIRSVMSTTKQVSQGDLTTNELSTQSKDELGSLGLYVNQMVASLRDLIENISKTSEQVAASSEQLHASSEETSKATESIAVSIQEIASGSETQVDTVAEWIQTTDQISGQMGTISNHINGMNEGSAKTKKQVESGTSVIQRVVEQMGKINESTQTTSEKIELLGEKSSKIGDMIHMITDVADQTNLLALNAAIEAARAGDHGKGFAVVADEVRKLAEVSNNSAKDIRSLVEEIQTVIKDSVISMEHGERTVSEGTALVENAGESFQSISEATTNVHIQIREMSQSVQEVSSQTAIMLEKAEKMRVIAENNSDNTQTVASSSEEQNATMEEISASAEILTEMAENLQQSVQRFRM
ncbi:methyl-accepting chemotaxis protein [Salipaludibacillus sp. HK11]|uniref:methyl-accepting chemotaxis protein n=1 Tax=Salipaludibacillus sp. HK11 TaxID=3394320 RepID=UPI0039FCEA0C